jgi:hypothetical protein
MCFKIINYVYFEEYILKNSSAFIPFNLTQPKRWIVFFKIMIQDRIAQVVIWGHKLYGNTYAYIHDGFFKAFKHLGYKTVWLDNNDDISSIDFSNTLFISEGQVDAAIPIRSDCFYILHNVDKSKYLNVPKEHKVIIQTYTRDVITTHKATLLSKTSVSYYKDDTIYMPFPTNLLPHEINTNIGKLLHNNVTNKNEVIFAGSYDSYWNEVVSFCNANNIQFRHFYNIPVEDNIKLVQESLISPTVLSDWQYAHDYIPCRIFKNISYGKMGVTHSSFIYELFDKKIIYDSNKTNMMQKAFEFERLPREEKNKRVIELMKYVRDNHTYLNRIDDIFWFFNNVINPTTSTYFNTYQYFD